MSTHCRQRLMLFSLLLIVSGCQAEQPRSSLLYRGPIVVDWIWSGALGADGLVLKAKLAEAVDPASVVLRVSRRVDLSGPLDFPAETGQPPSIVTFRPSGLEPGTRYYYAAVAGDLVERARRGTFQTLADGPASFTLAFGSCARTASTATVFDTIRRLTPLFFLHLGDFHYQSLEIDDPAPYRLIFDQVLASPAQSAMFRQIPVVYIWDDHDYGGDDSDASHPGRSTVRQVYQELVPHYPLAEGSGDVAIYHSFEVGRVRFIITDTRSERSPAAQPDGDGKTVLGPTQRRWLERELTRDRAGFPLVVWVNTLPWIAAREEGADHWGGYSHERRQIAEFIARERVSGLAMLSGDAHMLAIDDGSHSSFAGSREFGFPVFHAAALDRPGSVKGGPYSHGTLPGSGHIGLMRVEDRGDEIAVSWTGLSWRGDELMRHDFAVSAGGRP